MPFSWRITPSLVVLTFLFQMQAKSEAFARGVVGDTDAGNLAGSKADSQGPGEKERGDPKADEV